METRSKSRSVLFLRAPSELRRSAKDGGLEGRTSFGKPKSELKSFKSKAFELKAILNPDARRDGRGELSGRQAEGQQNYCVDSTVQSLRDGPRPILNGEVRDIVLWSQLSSV